MYFLPLMLKRKSYNGARTRECEEVKAARNYLITGYPVPKFFKSTPTLVRSVTLIGNMALDTPSHIQSPCSS
ncbi:hypothetical protein TNCV_4861091 [Trichonephila clavipes]|nr:hypothetical protein TNCV_4861091 [Trichonephila clavipes]